MPYTVYDTQTFYAAIVARIAASTGKNGDLAQAPEDTTYPYWVVYPGDETYEGSLNDPTQAVTFDWQVTVVSDNPSMCQWLQTKVRTALNGHVPVVAGLGTTPIELDFGSGVERDDSLSGNPTLFYARDRFVELASM